MASESVVQFTQDNFNAEVLKSTLPVLVDFWAPWCVPCKAIAPFVDQVADEFKGKVKVGKCNVDEAGQVAMNYGIRSIPTLLLFKDGAVIGQHTGKISKDKLKEFVAKGL